MASSYTSPLTVVRDVETSVLDGTAPELLRAGQKRRRWKKSGRVAEGGIAMGIEQITKYVNTSKQGGGEKWTGE